MQHQIIAPLRSCVDSFPVQTSGFDSASRGRDQRRSREKMTGEYLGAERLDRYGDSCEVSYRAYSCVTVSISRPRLVVSREYCPICASSIFKIDMGGN